MASMHFEEFTGKLAEVSTTEIESRRIDGLTRHLTVCRGAATLTEKLKDVGSIAGCVSDGVVKMALDLSKHRDALKVWSMSQHDEVTLLHGWYADLSICDKACWGCEAQDRPANQLPAWHARPCESVSGLQIGCRGGVAASTSAPFFDSGHLVQVFGLCLALTQGRSTGWRRAQRVGRMFFQACQEARGEDHGRCTAQGFDRIVIHPHG